MGVHTLCSLLVVTLALAPGAGRPTHPVREFAGKARRLTPDERTQLRGSLRDLGVPETLAAAEKKQLADGRTGPAEARSFVDRLRLACAWLGPSPEELGIRAHLVLEHLLDKRRAALRLDRLVAELAANGRPTLASVRRSLAPAPAEALVLTPASVPEEEARRAFREGEMLYHEGRIAIEALNPAADEKFTQSIRQMTVALRAGHQQPRALFYVGSALLWRAASPAELEQACQLLDSSVAAEHDKWTLFNLAMAHGRCGRTARLIALLERAVRFEPDFALAHLHLAVAYDGSSVPGDEEKAFAHARMAMRKEVTRSALLSVTRASQLARRTVATLYALVEKVENDQLSDADLAPLEARADQDPAQLPFIGNVAAVMDVFYKSLKKTP